MQRYKVYSGDICTYTSETITNYYKELVKNKETKSIKDISKELGVGVGTIYLFLNMVGISKESIGLEYSDYAKLILIHTEFPKNSAYRNERKKIIEELKERKEQRQKTYDTLIRLKQLRELKKARSELISTLNKVYEKKIK